MTTLGRVLFNELLPDGVPVRRRADAEEAPGRDHQRSRRALPDDRRRADRRQARDVGFYWATRSGVTVSMADVLVPPQGGDPRTLRGRADGLERKFQRGALTPTSVVTRWWDLEEATEEVGKAMEDYYPADNPIFMIRLGCTGNLTQVRNLSGMKGLVANPKGEFIRAPSSRRSARA